jgi:hypothetical protein
VDGLRGGQGRGTGLDHGFADIFQSAKSARSDDPGPRGAGQGKRFGQRESPGVAFDAQHVRQGLGPLGRTLPHTQDHQVGMVRGNGTVRGDPAELKIFPRRVRHDAVNAPAFESDAGGFGPVAIALEGFAEGAHVHIVNRGV